MDKHLYDVFAPKVGFQSYTLPKKITDGERVTIIAQRIELDEITLKRLTTQKEPLRFCSVKICLSGSDISCVGATEIIEGEEVNNDNFPELLTDSSLGQGVIRLPVSKIYRMGNLVSS